MSRAASNRPGDPKPVPRSHGAEVRPSTPRRSAETAEKRPFEAHLRIKYLLYLDLLLLRYNL